MTEQQQQPQLDLRDLFARIGELDFEVQVLRKSLQAANERLMQVSKQSGEKKEEGEKKKK